MYGTPDNKRIETRFACALSKLLRTIENAAAEAKTPQGVVSILTRYAQSEAYKAWCDSLALSLTTQVNEGAFKTWREAARVAGRGSELYGKILADLRTPLGGVFSLALKENASLIKTFPLELAQTLSEYIGQEAIKGRRSSDILGDLLKKYPDTAKSRLRLIARTEVSKTQTALIQGRSEQLGVGWYVWKTSGDARVRKSHGHMQGVLTSWKDPPSPEALAGEKPYGKYHAGGIFNCRCYPEPAVNVDYISFPAKAYYGGSIKTVTRAQFEKIM
jgi:SPP1 gp7 family putative phage head morphogenesis protein